MNFLRHLGILFMFTYEVPKNKLLLAVIWWGGVVQRSCRNLFIKTINLPLSNSRWSQRCLVHHLRCHHCHGISWCNYSLSSSYNQVSFSCYARQNFFYHSLFKVVKIEIAPLNLLLCDNVATLWRKSLQIFFCNSTVCLLVIAV